MSKPRNVLFLMSDQHHAGCLGVEGHPDVRTPRLDALAESGWRFTHGFCSNPICGPSRCSLLTGQPVWEHGMYGNTNYAIETPPPANLGAHFRARGWETAFVGKAHLPRRWLEDGFGWRRLSDFADAPREDPRGLHYFADLVAAGWADAYDHGKRHPGQPGADMEGFLSELPHALNLEAWTGRQARAFLQQRDPSRPFFLKVSFQRPHDPYAPSRDRGLAYDPTALTLPDNAGELDHYRATGAWSPAWERFRDRWGGGYPYAPRSADDLKTQLAHYLTLVEDIDTEIGMILDELERAGELEHTVVVYTADHGDYAGEHGLMLKNFGIYEAIHRVPLIVRIPGEEPRVCGRFADLADLFPTLCQACELPVPAEVSGQPLQGRQELLPDAEDVAFCDFMRPSTGEELMAVRTPRYRLVWEPEREEASMLFDRERDPGEVTNLWEHPDYRSMRDELRERLRELRQQRQVVFTPQDDRRVRAEDANLPTIRVHRGEPWSKVAASLEA